MSKMAPENLGSKNTKLGKKTKKIENCEIRGQPKSGRFWKTKKEKFSSINKTKGLKLTFDKKMALRKELTRIKDISKDLQKQTSTVLEERKEQRRQNIKKREEKRKKSEVVQVISNSSKIRRMKKKQLKFIEKRDTEAIGKK